MLKLFTSMPDHKKATSIFILFVVSGFIVLSMLTLLDGYRNAALEREWNIIESTIDKANAEATVNNKTIVKEMEVAIDRAYPDKSLLEKDFRRLDTVTPLTTAISNAAAGNYLFGIPNDHNDGFVMNKNSLVSDASADCSKEFGMQRTFENEVSMHFAKTLAQKALENLVKDYSDEIVWSFLPVDGSLPWSEEVQNLEYVDYRILKELYMKYDGDIRVLQSFEFLTPEYIYRDRDLLGNPIVNAVGKRTENYQLIYVQGYNIVDVLSYLGLKSDIEDVNVRINDYSRLIYIISMGLISICVLYLILTGRESKNKSK